MKNIIILGSGRSGTSMMAGLLAKSCYHMGDNLHDADASNPFGYFESYTINNQINEPILAGSLPDKLKIGPFSFFRNRPSFKQRWLGKLPLGKSLFASSQIEERIKKAVSKRPFCYKDPRFSYTLPVWMPFLPTNTVFLVVFRHPQSTVLSMMKEVKKAYLSDLKFSENDAYQVWYLMYAHILNMYAIDPDKFLFVNYVDLLQYKVLEDIEAFTGASVDRHFIKPELYRNKVENQLFKSGTIKDLYSKLLSLSTKAYINA